MGPLIAYFGVPYATLSNSTKDAPFEKDSSTPCHRKNEAVNPTRPHSSDLFILLLIFMVILLQMIVSVLLKIT